MPTIGQIIHNSKVYNPEHEVMPIAVLDEYFEPVNKKKLNTWALDLSEYGYKTSYLDTNYELQAGIPCGITVQCEISNDKSKYYASTTFGIEDGQLTINIEKVKKLSGEEGENIANKLFRKHAEFLEKYETKRKDGLKDKFPSKITICASAGKDKNNEWMNGGYTWANQGFSFTNKEEQDRMQTRFKSYLADRDIKMSDSDLKLFTHPCHYAAFDCGVRFKNREGKTVNIGKDFLSKYYWEGKWEPANPDSKEKIYAKRYNAETVKGLRRRRAIPCLGPKYYKMMKKYFNICSGKKMTHEPKVHERLAKIQKSRRSKQPA